MVEKTKRKRGVIPRWMRFMAAFLPCIGIGLLDVVFFMSTGYICAAFPLSIVVLIVIGNMVWSDEQDTEAEKPKRDDDEDTIPTSLLMQEDNSESRLDMVATTQADDFQQAKTS